MLLAPATFVVLFVAALLAIGGVVFILIAQAGGSSDPHRRERAAYEIEQLRRASSTRIACPDPRCAHANPSAARFCAMCGAQLAPTDASENPQPPLTRE
ncbi:MAG: hypothetical protein AB7Q17_17845 [Phycisphaerae bacterium]